MVHRRVRTRDVEDLAQLCFLAIYEGLPRYEPKRPLFPWLKAIVYRTIRDHLKRWSSQRELLISKREVDLRANSEEELGTQELFQSLMVLLTERQREIYRRRMIDGASVKEIATDLQITESGVLKNLEAIEVKLKVGVARHEAREQRLLGKLRSVPLPLGLSALLPADLFTALVARVKAWSLRVVSAWRPVLAAAKVAAPNLGVCAGLSLTLSAPPAPPLHPVAPREDVISTVARPATAAVAMPRPIVASAPAALAIQGPLSAVSSDNRAAGSPVGRSPVLESRSLHHVRALLATDPDEALAALELHKSAFPCEQLAGERRGIEAMARVASALQRRVRASTAPL